MQPTDYAFARWYGDNRNYEARSSTIDRIIVHTTEGPTAASGMDWMARQGTSAHYIIDTDGTVYQTVRESNTAWHAGNGVFNSRSIGIEHVGYMNQPDRYFTAAMLTASTRLVTDLCRRYNISLDREHIIGHAEVPDPDHPGQWGGTNHRTDPGPQWPWGYYLMLARGGGYLNGHLVPPDFLTFWQTRGGLAIFGYPTSELKGGQGHEYQWFERARIERHPELQGGQQIQLGLVGNEAKQARGE